jgi:energy-coupling factor transporter ATP-binding protein EcfA2
MAEQQEQRFATLKLPKRYEALEREATQSDADLSRIVQRVDTAASRVETLLRQVRDGGLGRFEVFLGPSGSGKTTFFKTLTRFFSGTEVHEIQNGMPLEDVANHIRTHNYKNSSRQVWVLVDRDNPTLRPEEAFRFFETLRVLFREDAGKVVICWPITDVPQAELLSKQAWEVGRDSVVDLNKGLYRFTGPSKSDFLDIADLTVRTLIGQSLEVFGISKEIAEPLAAHSETISEFYSRLEAKSAEISGLYRDLLKERRIPNIWILVAGDDSKDLNLTIANLTQGTQNYVDIDQIISYLDHPELDAAYLKEWKKRRSQVAFILRMLDVRVFELSPNASLSAVRAFGDEDLRKTLKLPKASEAVAAETLRKTSFIQAIIDPSYSRTPYSKATDQQASHEYRRIQVRAGSDDKRLNKALAAAIKAALSQDGVAVEIKAEKQATDSNLKPDIHVTMPSGRIYCLEPTWRSTGKGIDGELPDRQNTLTVGHIRKYLLEKILGYVNDLNL